MKVGEEVAEGVEVFAGADRGSNGVADAAESEEVPAPCRFFDPHEVELLFHLADFADGLFGRPVLVGIDHQSRFVGVDAEGFVHETDAAEIAVLIEPDLELAVGEAVFFRHRAVEVEDFLVGERHV